MCNREIIILVSFVILCLIWKDLLAVFFDESHAMSIGLSPLRLKILFFTLLSACTVAALQTVGAILVIAMVVTPGATAYLLTDHFSRLLVIAIAIGAFTGGVIVTLQTLVFLLAFFLAPKHGLLATRYRRRQKRRHPPASLPKDSL
jgi:manganese/iron transport system permease protein